MKFLIAILFFNTIFAQGELPPYGYGKQDVAAESIPQVNAPRLFIQNFPKPSTFNFQNPVTQIQNEINTPTLDASPDTYTEQHKTSSQSFMLQNGHNFTFPRLLKKKHKNRKLTSPYLNFEHEYVDIGSGDDSPFSFATEPYASSMGPFIPRAQPPQPIRLQMQSYTQDTAPRKKMYDSERKMKAKKNELLEVSIMNNIEKLEDQISNVDDLLTNLDSKLKDQALKIYKKEEKKNETKLIQIMQQIHLKIFYQYMLLFGP